MQGHRTHRHTHLQVSSSLELYGFKHALFPSLTRSFCDYVTFFQVFFWYVFWNCCNLNKLPMNSLLCSINIQICCDFKELECFWKKLQAGFQVCLILSTWKAIARSFQKHTPLGFKLLMFANQTTTLNTTAGLLTQTLCFPQLVIESPHCLIGNRMTSQPDLKHLLKLVGTSALPFKNKNYIINRVKWRLVFCWISRNERTPGLSEHSTIRDVFHFPETSLLAEASSQRLALFPLCDIQMLRLLSSLQRLPFKWHIIWTAVSLKYSFNK